jgi:uncharacterized protein with von Willebrand factor type A (vWA) domain
MDNSRRSFLTAIVPGAALASVALLTPEAQQSKPTRPSRPDSSQAQDAYQKDQQQTQPPGALPETPKLTPAGRKAILTDDQKQIQKDVDELFELVQDLKSQAEKMDATAVLSLQFVQKTEEIEKLARKIRSLARG